MARVEVMIEKRRIKYCNRGRRDDKAREKFKIKINEDKENGEDKEK